MKPAPFQYLAPSSLEEALVQMAQVSQEMEDGVEVKFLAGGQSLVPTMNFRLAQPGVLIDLNPVAELAYVEATVDGGLRLGAMTRQRAVEKSPLVARRAPLLAATLPYIAHPQIRNRGTVGGSLAHADPAAELPAVMLALQARFLLKRRGRERWVEAQDFFTGLFATALDPDELLAEIALPAPRPKTGWAFREISRRHGDYALAGVAAVVSVDEGNRIEDPRLVFLSVGEGPVVAHQAASLLQGQVPTPQVLEAAAEKAAHDDTDPSPDIHASAAYRRQLVRVLTVDAVTEATRRALGTLDVGEVPGTGA